MFTSISWLQYLIASLALATIYYSAILLLYYRVEIAFFFKKKTDNSANSEIPRFSNRTILGEAKADLTIASVSNEELLFNSDAEAN